MSQQGSDEAEIVVADKSLAGIDRATFFEKVTGVVPSILYVFNVQTLTNEYTNSNFGEWLGMTQEEIDALGVDVIHQYGHPDDLPALQAHFEKVLTLKDGERATSQYRLRAKSGEWKWFQSIETPYERDDTGALLRVIGTSTDVTAQKMAEQDLLDHRKAAKVATTGLQQHVEKISGELVDPTKDLVEKFELLRAKIAQDDDNDASRGIRSGFQIVNQMNEFINDALSYSQILVTQRPFERVALEELLRDVVRELHDEIEAAEAIVDVGDLPDVMGDAHQLATLFRRLITHAVKHRRPDTALIVVISDTTPAASDKVEISVTDNGKQAPLRSMVADDGAFRRVFLEYAPPTSGLAPAICQRIAINHGGEIKLRSFPSKKVAYSLQLDPA